MASLKRSRAEAARLRAEQAAPVLERMEEARAAAEGSHAVVVRVRRDSWVTPRVLILVSLLLVTVMTGLMSGGWPFRTTPESAMEIVGHGRQQLLHLEALRIVSVREVTGRLPATLDQVEVGLDRLLIYEVLDQDQFGLALAGQDGARVGGEMVFDAAAIHVGRGEDGR